MAPEMFTSAAPEAKGQWDLKAIDMWALGVVYFTLLTGRFPWAVANEEKSPEFSEYLRGTLTSRYPWHKLSSRSLHLLERLLCVDASQRGTADEVCGLVDIMVESVRADQLKAARAMLQHNISAVPTANIQPMKELQVCKAA